MTTSDRATVPFRIADHVLHASPYVPEWLDLDRSRYIRLDRNENTRPLPAAVREALARGIDAAAVQSYPEPAPLHPLVAEYAGVPADHVMVTNGSDQGIDLTVRLALPPGGSMAVARPEFAVFHHVADAIGGRILGVPYGPGFEFPYAEFTAAVESGRPDLITLINPNNPTGTAIDPRYVESVVASNPGVAIIVDEAYYEYTGHTVARLTERYPNLMVLRTFSKAFAMAGLRLGYVIAAPEIIGHLRKLQNPFDVNQLAIVAGTAQLARADEAMAEVRDAMEVVKPFVVRSLTELGVEFTPGSANFVLIRPRDCADAVRYLSDAGILVRSMTAPALRGTFRVSLGTLTEMRRFIEVFGTYVNGERHVGSDPNRPKEWEG
ncbi:pyridoxal phosphate-dependent aminotransferase [Nocardia arizonensis]|uniref:pyridoxal phosphate-dependent aminotransferase n=1 Tax=Nocardia arizonensis TaxID=1141647 RepID=UPI0006D0B0BA|nr:histidinol-phosphate transaminase [Nocardia arizonensis]